MKHLNLRLFSKLLLIIILTFFAPIHTEQSTVLGQGLATQLFDQGLSEYRSQKFELALQTLQQAHILFEDEADLHGESRTKNMMAAVHIATGNYQEAIRLSESALELAQKIENLELQIESIGNLGISYQSLGRYLVAIEQYQEALEIAKESGNRSSEGHLLGLIGNTHISLGDYDSALSLHQKSLEILLQSNNAAALSVVLGNLGTAYVHLEEFRKALESYTLSLQVAREIDDHEGVAYALNNLASVYDALGDETTALGYYQESLEIAKSIHLINLEIEVMSNLGTIYENLDDYEQAIDFYDQSLAKAQSIRSPKAAAMAFNNLGHALFDSGRHAEAEYHLRAAIDQLEDLRPTLDDNYNVSLFDTQIFTYSLLQQILVAQEKNEAALEISERGRAQAFVDLLAQRATPERVENISNLERQPLSIEEIKTIAREQNATLVEYALVPDDDFKFQGRLRAPSSGIFVWIVKPTGEVAFKHIDLTSLLPKDTSLIELISDTRKALDTGNGGSIRSTEICHEPSNICLGDRVQRNDNSGDQYQYEVAEIDPEAETVILYRPDSYLPEPEFPIAAVEKVDTTEAWHNRLNQLHQILINPIKGDLPQDPEERVIFIPQEELFLVPFPALQDSFGDYLITHHTISTIPSIQVLAKTRQRRLELTHLDSIHQSDNALIVGNPSPMPVLQPELPEANPLPALPESETEAREIAQMLNTEALVGSAATETAVKQRLSEARVIHLATHGLFRETGDALQSNLALASGSEEQDGFLTAEEILDYSLQADLVVLSACDTGRGQITGDGVIGLSRSFIAAGTPSIIVSLWQVPDADTSDLMIQFYQNRQTLDKAQSLRQAMLHMIEQGLEPKDWAAFTLIGEAE